jgi:hypothetical protein
VPKLPPGQRTTRRKSESWSGPAQNCRTPDLSPSIVILQAKQEQTEVTSVTTTVTAQPAWFALFLADRGTRKPSPHTLKAYRQDFEAIAALLRDDAETMAGLPVSALTKDAMRIAFAKYANTHEPASIRRCWSTWNMICTYLYTAELISSNPMPFGGPAKGAENLAQVTNAGCSGGVVGSHRARRGLSTQ